jgi:hypothetical protein
MQKSDTSLKAAVEHAIWNDDVLRAIEYYEIDVDARNGIVYLNGHIANTTSRIRIENAIRSVPGILGVRNRLVLDEKLTLEVAGVLGALEHTYDCKFFTGSSHGVVSITGTVSSDNVRSLAEICVARNPNVRAVINRVRVSGDTTPEQPDLPFLQPVIGENIYFLDGLSGIVKRVIINPNNRRVIAMVLLVDLTAPQLPVNLSADGNTRLPAQLVSVPMDAVRYLTKVSGFLSIDQNERDRYQDFDPAAFLTPSTDWTPPYPYCPQEVLFPVAYPKMEHPAAQPIPFEDLLDDASLKQQFFATNDLGVNTVKPV